MTKEITFILEEKNPYKQGNCFEGLVRNVLESQRYEVKSDVNYTGMEIDLIANHKDRNEEIYVECKAKEKVSADEIKKFAFSVDFKNIKTGLFIRTKELQHQAAGILDEMKKDPEKRYDHLTFFEPEKVISLLQESKLISKHQIPEIQIGKEILAITYFGDYYILILKDSLASTPTKALIINANEKSNQLSSTELELIKTSISEIKDLELEEAELTKKLTTTTTSSSQATEEVESISEVQESINWYDYLPASSEHFVGRDKVRTDILHFFENVLDSETKRRVFYLTGKSGWGKSSLVAELRGRVRNKYYKNRFHVTAIDSRSALSSNFVALAFKRMLRHAAQDGFIEKDLFTENISFNSSYNILDSEGISSFFENLSKERKVLVLIFDQFEDVFRKPGLFKAFYKFLTDVSDFKYNLIVGFSWKTEILIPSENEAYHYWQQSKEQAENFVIPEFGSKETNLIIGQLEKSIGKIDTSLKRRIVESSQGFPWLIKKLCVHIYDQVQAGKKIQELVDENLNFESLFNQDLEKLTGPEVKYLRYIAQRAYDGNFFEASEVNDAVPETVINSLRDDKRLLIRSGLNYNIYWDIFRDYLVTGKVPEIGESYIIRSSPNSCMDIFLLFETSKSLSALEIRNSLEKDVTTQTIENCIIDLRSLGVLRKSESSDKYKLTNAIEEVNEAAFQEIISERLKSNTVYQKTKVFRGKIDATQIIDVLKEIFKGYTYQDKTWKIYANYFLNWFEFSNLDISDRVLITGKGKGKVVTFYKNIEEQRKESIPRNTPEQVVNALNSWESKNLNELGSSLLRDLALLDLTSYEKESYFPTSTLENLKEDEVEEVVSNQSLLLGKINTVKEFLEASDSKISAKKLIESKPELFDKSLLESSKTIYSSFMLRWARFVIKNGAQHSK